MHERKLIKLADCQVKIKGSVGTFEGYASTFGNIDSYNDTIIPGAYKQAAEDAAAGKFPAMFFNHISRRSDMGAKIGRYTHVEEDSTGLLVAGSLSMEHPIAKNIYPSLKDGLLTGLSIGYRVPEGGATLEASGVRALRKILLDEISIVEEPADDFARLDSFKGVVTIRDAEYALRDAGLSSNDAKALLSHLKRIFTGEKEAADPAMEAKAKQDAELLAYLNSLYGAKA